MKTQFFEIDYFDIFDHSFDIHSKTLFCIKKYDKFIELRQNSEEFPILLALHRFEVASQLSNPVNELAPVAHRLFRRDRAPENPNQILNIKIDGVYLTCSNKTSK